jgi:hypothetical protein
MKRLILTLALMTLGTPVFSQSIPLGEIVGSDRSIRDPLYKVTARYPVDWVVRGVTRWGDRETTIFLGEPMQTGFASLYYRIPLDSRPIIDLERYLREEAKKKTQQRIEGGLADYAMVTDSFTFRLVGELPALSYVARFTVSSTTYTEYFVRVLSPKGEALFFLRAPAEHFEPLRVAFETMVESLRLP